MVRGGAQRLALDTAAHFAARGHAVEVWCGPETGAEGSLHEFASAAGLPVRVFPSLVRRIDPVLDLRALRELTGALRETRPDLVHTNSSKAGIVGREAAWRAGVPRIVHSVHGWGFTPRTPALQRAVFALLERRAARRCHALICVSEGDYEAGRAAGIVGNTPVTLIPSGIDLREYRDEARLAELRRARREQLGVAEGALVVGFLGRFAPQKDPARALAVFRDLFRSEAAGRPLHLLMVGDGELMSSLRRAAADLPAEHVHWTGLVSDPWSWLAAMDLLLFPSQWEGSPLVILEALALGLPIVANEIAGTRSLLGPIEPTWLVSGDEREGFRAAAEARLREVAPVGAPTEPWSSPRGARRRAHVFARHEIGAMCRQVGDVYDSIRVG